MNRTARRCITIIPLWLDPSYNSSWKSSSPMLLPAPPPPRMPMWLSMIWKSSPGCGIRPDSILDQTGMSFREISNAPVLMSWNKLKKHLNRTLRSNLRLKDPPASPRRCRGRRSSCRRRSCSRASKRPSPGSPPPGRGRGWRRRARRGSRGTCKCSQSEQLAVWTWNTDIRLTNLWINSGCVHNFHCFFTCHHSALKMDASIHLEM